MGGTKALPKSTYNGALSYMIKSYIGAGCLSLPLAFQRSGVVLGMFMLTSLFIIIVFNLRALVLCKRHWESKGVNTYADLAFVTLGYRGKQLIEWLVNLTQLGICSVYFDFVAENLHAMLPASPLTSTQACMAYLFPMFGVLALLPSVESIAPYTGLANALFLATIAIVLVFGLVYLGTSGVGEGMEYGKVESCPLFFATAVYSFEGIANLLPVENSLEDRTQIWSLLYTSIGVVGMVYASVGLISYLAWPDTTAGSITAELATRVGGPVVGMSGWMVIIAVILTFPVQLFPAVELLELRLGFRESHVHSSQAGAAKHEREGFHEVKSTDSPFGIELEDDDELGGPDDDDDDVVKFHQEEEMDYEGAVDTDGGVDVEGMELTTKHGHSQAALSPVNGSTNGHASNPLHTPTTGELEDDPLPDVSELSNDMDKLALEMFYGSDEEESSSKKPKRMPLKRKVFRVGLVFATWMAAVLVPNLGALIALIGAVSGSLLAIILPALIDLRSSRPNENWKRYFRNYLFIGVGVVGGVWGSILAFIQAVNGKSIE